MNIYVVTRGYNLLDNYEYFTKLEDAQNAVDTLMNELHKAGSPTRWGDNVGKLHDMFQIQLLEKHNKAKNNTRKWYHPQ